MKCPVCGEEAHIIFENIHPRGIQASIECPDTCFTVSTGVCNSMIQAREIITYKFNRIVAIGNNMVKLKVTVGKNIGIIWVGP